jgi:hypothetical protein
VVEHVLDVAECGSGESEVDQPETRVGDSRPALAGHPDPPGREVLVLGVARLSWYPAGDFPTGPLPELKEPDAQSYQ